jgi:hypothetical protein
VEAMPITASAQGTMVKGAEKLRVMYLIEFPKRF